MEHDSNMTQPERQPLNSARELEEAANTLVEHARHTLCIFDFNLADMGYNSPTRYELLSRFLLESRANRLEIVLHDTDYVMRYCPRLLQLQRQFSHAMAFFQTTGEARKVYDPFTVADAMHCLRRFHYDHPRGVLTLHNIPEAQNLMKRFEELKAASKPAIPPTTLGL
jgi:hypothetical protein